MTKDEALKLIETAPYDSKLSRVNQSLTRKQAVDIVKSWLVSKNVPEILPELFEKRVWQVVKDQRYPRY